MSFLRNYYIINNNFELLSINTSAIMNLILKTVGGILMFNKEVYEAPVIEVTEFELHESIADSANPSQGALGFDEIWGN